MTGCATVIDPRITLRIAGIVGDSITDGPGLRLTVFAQGCPHHCPGCHNPETHDPAGGKLQTAAEIFALYAENPLLDGITFSGGEPFCQPQPLLALARAVHAFGGNVITYTGYCLEELQAMNDEAVLALLTASDCLIDGKFILSKRTLEKPFCGSANQRFLRKGIDY